MNTETTPRGAWSRGPYSQIGLVGLLTPPANTTLEPELVALLPRGISLHTARLPGSVDDDTTVGLRERLLGYYVDLDRTVDAFGGMPLDAIMYGNTASEYAIGEAARRKALIDLGSAGAKQVVTAAGSIRSVMEAAGVRRFAMASPYPDWGNELAAAFWREQGIEVTDIASARDSGSIFAIPTKNVLRAVRDLDLTGAEAILLSGTGMPTLEPLTILSQEIGLPIVSSNTCMVWATVKAVAPGSMKDAHPLVRMIDEWISRAGGGR